MARSDLNWTDFIEVSETDVLKISEMGEKGFITSSDGKTINPPSGLYELQGTFRNGSYTPPDWSAPCPINGGKVEGVPTNEADTKTYFYKGFDSANCIDFLIELGVI